MKPLLDEVYQLRDQFIHLDKDPYLSPNFIHRKIFWQRIYLTLGLLDQYVNSHTNILDFGTNQGVIVPDLVRQFDQVTSLELREVRSQTEQKQNLESMVNHFGLDIEKIKYVDIEENDQKLSDLPDDSFDAIIATDVLEHVPNLDTLMDTFQRILKPNGKLIVSIPTENFLYRLGVRLNDLVFKMGTDRDFHINDEADIDNLLRQHFLVETEKTLWTFFHFYVLNNQ